MKLNKDQIQKIVLGGMMFCGVIYSYFEFLLGPLTASREQMIKDTEALGPQIAVANGQIEKAKALGAKAPASQEVVAQVKTMIPQGSPIAWVPTKLADFFKKEGVEKTTSRMLGELGEKELTGFGRYSWAIEVPRVEFVNFGKVLMNLENAEPLMEIQSLEVEAGREEPQFQRVTITLHNIVRL